MNKLGANMQCISSAEQLYTKMQAGATKDDEALATRTKTGAHIDLAAG